jgi:hypothetical protein
MILDATINLPGCVSFYILPHRTATPQTKTIIMRKTFTGFLFILLIVTTINAQQSEKFDPAKDKEAFQGYSIHLMPVPGNTFGFIIIKDKRAIWSQINNPFTHGQEGFLHKQDAYKVAEWIVNESIKNGKVPRQIPPALAKQLNLSADLIQH